MPRLADRVRTGLRPRRRFRLATGRARLLPSFLIIGAQRAGTTSLLHSLRQHPDIAGPTAGEKLVLLRKEVHFFDLRFSEGVDWYRSFFPLSVRRRLARLRGRDLAAGESTPYYLFHPEVPGRVAATLPDVKLIALLRDPVERAYSHYQHRVRAGREKLSFEDALAAEQSRLSGGEEALLNDPATRGHHLHRAYFARGLYAEQLERWFGHFPGEQLLVLRSEDFFERPEEAYAEVLAYLGVRPWQLGEHARRNRASYAPLDPALRAELEARYAEPNARLAELLGRDFGWDSPPARIAEAEAHEVPVSIRRRR
ncbi:MAG: sulfotransferase family protein [Gaiellaceae bacterium]